MEHLEGALLRYAAGLTLRHQTRLERLARAKHSSLLRTFVNYERCYTLMGSCLTTQRYTKMNKLKRDEHSSL
jgi:hypothetical protein